MSLASFLEFGGESVIRGLLSLIDVQTGLSPGDATASEISTVYRRLTEKGRVQKGMTKRELSRVITDTKRAMRAAQETGATSGIPPTINRIPLWHQPGNPDQVSYTVRIRINMPDGTPADVISIVTSDKVLTSGQVYSAAIENISNRYNIVSDPRRAARGGVEIQSYAILSVYRGQPT